MFEPTEPASSSNSIWRPDAFVQAGLLPNPEIVNLFPVTDKPFKYAFEFPLEALWLRPIRLAAAERESHRVSQRLFQVALDLIRDTRQGYADALVATGRVKVAEQAVQLRHRIAKVAQARLDAGDASPQKVTVAKIDVDLAQQAFRQLLDSLARREQLHGEVRRAWAELERSVRRHLPVDQPADPPAAPVNGLLKAPAVGLLKVPQSVPLHASRHCPTPPPLTNSPKRQRGNTSPDLAHASGHCPTPPPPTNSPKRQRGNTSLILAHASGYCLLPTADSRLHNQM